ncbi:MAG TPA: hypothetical protein VHC69_03680 [Polyangiaceae bacterium]|nr:hypothetical protein [Polyangiaceae bacterium]
MARARPRHYSYGGTAAIVTSVGLIVGLGAAGVPRASIVSGLLVVGIADNVSDSLSIHMYQESENLEGRSAFHATLTNFVARFLVVMSFVGIAVVAPFRAAPIVALTWGMLLLGALTHRIARARGVSPWRETLKHVFVALLVVAVSRALGAWIAANVR